ncbi:MAG: Methyltransferase type 12 [Patescibacteria group bacterium]|nr:Methyltransferase type 12 [Patescibacteria group bacterium]
MENKENNIFEHIDCPVCDGNSFKTVLKFTPDEFLNEERKKYYNVDVLGVDLKTNFFIKKCKKCGFVFVNPRLRKDLYNVVYNEAKSGQYEMKSWMFDSGDIGNLFATYNKYREVFPLLNVLIYFGKYFEKPKNDAYKQLKLLDYGCGMGHILDLCKTFGIKGIGVDIDSFRLNHCKQKGLDARLPEELPDAEKFHIVISTSVVEHVNDLDAYFKYISSRLIKGGIFYFNGLNPRIIEIERKKRLFKIVMPLEHINYFTRKTLLMLAEKYGFEEAKGGGYGVFAMKNSIQYSYPFLKRFIFKGFYPTGNFEVTLEKKS